MNTLTNPEYPVVLFIPETGMYSYIRGLAVLGDVVAQKGGRVLLTHDTGQMLRTSMMAKKRLPAYPSAEDLATIQTSSDKKFHAVCARYGFGSIELEELVTPEILKKIHALVDEARGPLEEIMFLGFPIGRMAQFDFMLETKSFYAEPSSTEHRDLYGVYIKNAALALALTDRICERYTPSLFLTWNEYGQGQAVRWSAQSHGVAHRAGTYPVHYNIDASRFSIWEVIYGEWINRHCQRWNEGKDVPIPPRDVTACFDDSMFRMYGSGSHIFSTQKKADPEILFKQLGLDPHKKIIVVYTSNQEERGALEITLAVWGGKKEMVDLCTDQAEWLSLLREYAQSRNDVQIVVRLHPRGSARFGVESPHVKKLRALFAEDTASFKVLWPDDLVSSYDLMELADLCLVSWSSMGHEAARLGVPALASTAGMTYCDDDFIQVATSRDVYMEKLDAMLKMKSTWHHLVKAVRFYHWRMFLPTLDLGETVPVKFNDETVWPEAPAAMREVLYDVLSGAQDLLSYTIQKWKGSLTAESAEREDEAVRFGVRRFLDVLFYPPPLLPTPGPVSRMVRRVFPFMKKREHPFVDYRLEYSADTAQQETLREKTAQDSHLRVILADGPYATLIHKGGLIRRMSPLALRLARIYQESVGQE